MIYLRTREHKKKRWYPALVGLSIVFLAVLIGFTPLFSSLREILYPLFTHLFRVTNTISQNASHITLKSRKALQTENDALREKLNTLNVKVLLADSVFSENEALRETLGNSPDRELILADVLSKPNLSPYDTLLITKGSEHSISPGAVVYADRYIPIGIVVEVYRGTSLIQLFSSPQVETAVLIGTSNILGTAVGVGGGNFRLLLPKDSLVKEGDTLSLPGVHPTIIGIVDTIISRPEDTFIRILSKHPTNIFSITRVYVAKNSP